MKLYMHPISTSSRSILMFVADNELAIELHVVDLMTGEHLKEPFRSLNPNCLVPVLVDGDLILTESSSILKYLADKFDLPSYPRDIRQRAKVNEAMDWINTNFYRDFGYGLCYPQLFPNLKRRSDEAQGATLDMGKEYSKRWLKVLNDHWIGPDKNYLIGDDITIADYFGACLVSIGEIIKVDFSAYPNIRRWLDHMAKLSAWPKVNEAFYGLVGAVKDQLFVTIA